jgi:hypothetical protein
MRIVREFPIIAGSIMQGLAQRLIRRKGNYSEY